MDSCDRHPADVDCNVCIRNCQRERDSLKLQIGELMKALKALGQYIPANLDPRGEVTYQVFIPGSAIAPAWNILHGVTEKPWCEHNYVHLGIDVFKCEKCGDYSKTGVALKPVEEAPILHSEKYCPCPDCAKKPIDVKALALIENGKCPECGQRAHLHNCTEKRKENS